MPNSINGERLLAVLTIVFARLPQTAQEFSRDTQEDLPTQPWDYQNFTDMEWDILSEGLAEVSLTQFTKVKFDGDGEVYWGRVKRTVLKANRRGGSIGNVFIGGLTLKRMHKWLIQEYHNGFSSASLDAVIVPVLKLDGLFKFEKQSNCW